MLEPEEVEKVTGHVEVRQVFRVPGGSAAGCYVTDGIVSRTSNVRLIRDSIVIYAGKIGSLKRFKDDAREVRDGFECGMRLQKYDDVKVGDVIEAYEIEKVSRTL